MRRVLGIDIGGTGTKAAIIDTDNAELLTERFKVPTPEGAKPQALLELISEFKNKFSWNDSEPVGIGFPSIIRNGVCYSATNISKKWLGLNLNDLFRERLDNPNVHCINDADAAGIAEMAFGAGKDCKGTVLLLTLGTGIGSALFREGILVPNTELGSLKFKKSIAEKYASNKIRKTQELDWDVWASRLNEYLQHVEFLFSPDLIILGGGVSKSLDIYRKYIKLDCKLAPATLLNAAGVVGAAKYSADRCE